MIEELVDKAESPAVEKPEQPTEEAVGEAPEEDAFEPVNDLIERINRSRPVEVQLLRSTPAITGLDPAPTGKPLAVICYLAFHRDVPTQRIRDTFWVGRPRKTADNAISDIRRLLGADESGTPYLGDATNNGNYELSDEIGCDWTRITQLIDAARNRSATEAATILHAALKLVDGQAGGDAPIGIYGWLIDVHETYSTIGSTIADAAHQLGEHAVSNGDADLATWAAAKGLAAVPGNEAMRRIEMRAAAIAGNTRGIHDAYEAAAHHAAELGTWVEVEPETDDLLQDLMKPSAAQAS